MADEHEQELSAEELFRQLKVSDVLLGTLASLVQVGYAKLGEGEASEARLAIEALRALIPVIEGTAPADGVRDLRRATANLQLAYADRVAQKPEPEAEPKLEPEAGPEEEKET